MSTTIETPALHRDEQGHCEITTAVLTDGTPEPYVHGELEHVGTTELHGWGGLDDEADVWEPTALDSDQVRPALLIPRTA